MLSIHFSSFSPSADDVKIFVFAIFAIYLYVIVSLMNFLNILREFRCWNGENVDFRLWWHYKFYFTFSNRVQDVHFSEGSAICFTIIGKFLYRVSTNLTSENFHSSSLIVFTSPRSHSNPLESIFWTFVNVIISKWYAVINLIWHTRKASSLRLHMENGEENVIWIVNQQTKWQMWWRIKKRDAEIWAISEEEMDSFHRCLRSCHIFTLSFLHREKKIHHSTAVAVVSLEHFSHSLRIEESFQTWCYTCEW